MKILTNANDFIKGITITYSGGYAIFDILVWLFFIYWLTICLIGR